MTQASAARAFFSTVLAPVTIVLVPVTTFGAASQAAQDSARPAVSPRHFAPMVARSIGPAGMSGRVSDIDVNPREPTTIFVGAATGGVWRSRDGGVSWQPVFDDQPVLGVGAVAVSPSNPDVVWVGTGEGNPRNSAGVGNGVYRSLDGGDSWEFMGLDGSERIHRIVIHPEDPRTVFVGAMGPAWSDGEQRGVFRTTDGGASWERILYVDEGTGVADLVMDPENPDKLFAAMWSYRRWPWFFRSGGPGSGLYVTRNGGANWSRLGPEDGLPAGELGRIGVAISRSNPDVVYALVEAERSELLRSDDGGVHWRTVNDRDGVAPRPFYYADLRVDPSNENRLYSLHGAVQVSEDAGLSFRTVVPSQIIHGDVHELWIHPRDSRFMILGEDGGIAITHDRGRNWRFVENLPLAQFYHLDVDMDVPFNVYGGLQDNGSWFGPMTVWAQRGIMNLHWTRVGSGDGFRTLTDLGDPRYGYSMSQGGNLRRFDKTTGERRDIKPLHPEGAALRFNWNTALSQDPHEPATIYLGSQFVHRSRDGGASWEIISPDLTTNDSGKQRQSESGGLSIDNSGAENHTTILSIQPSPVEPGLIWVTTDDGNVQVTRDGGATWTNTGGNIPGVPAATYIPHVEASRHDPATAYVVLDDHRRGNWTPYVYRTEDYGSSWQSVATDDIYGYAHVIEEDPEEPRLLFLGTEFGMYVSFDAGASWTAWRNGLPPAPVRGIVVHPRDHDLAIGTHGRAAYIIDDIRPLRALAAELEAAGEALRVFPLAPAIQYVEAEAQGYRSTGHAMFMGDLRPYGALLHYWLAQGTVDGGAAIEVLDGSGEVIRTLAGTANRGLNRVVWDLRMAGEDDGAGPWALPGRYAVRVTVGETIAEGTIEVVADPRVDISPASRRARIAAQQEAARWVAVADRAAEQLRAMLSAVDQVLITLPDGEGADELRAMGEALREELNRANQRLFTGPECQGGCGGSAVADRVRAPQRKLSSSMDAPSETDRLAMAHAEAAVEELVEEFRRVMDGPAEEFRRALAARGHTPLPLTEPLRGRGGSPDGARPGC